MIYAQVKSVRADKKVIDFLTNCGNKNLQYLLVPARLDSALAQMDTDRDGEFSLSEWEDAIETALSNKLAQRAAAREAQRKAAAKEIAVRKRRPTTGFYVTEPNNRSHFVSIAGIYGRVPQRGPALL